jgi:transcriptional regulator
MDVDMYVPGPFRSDDTAAELAVIDANPFGMLVSRHEDRIVATHLPMLLWRECPNVIEGHLARANPQWRSLGEQETLAVFRGAHTHISPTWYETSPAVPTWDYVAVHAYGSAEVIEDPLELDALVSRLSQAFEPRWRFDDQPERFRSTMLRGIVGFRMTIERLDGSFKLSQNRSAADRAGVTAALRERSFGEDLAVADLIERHAPAGR